MGLYAIFASDEAAELEKMRMGGYKPSLNKLLIPTRTVVER